MVKQIEPPRYRTLRPFTWQSATVWPAANVEGYRDWPIAGSMEALNFTALEIQKYHQKYGRDYLLLPECPFNYEYETYYLPTPLPHTRHDWQPDRIELEDAPEGAPIYTDRGERFCQLYWPSPHYKASNSAAEKVLHYLSAHDRRPLSPWCGLRNALFLPEPRELEKPTARAAIFDHKPTTHLVRQQDGTERRAVINRATGGFS